MALSHWNGGRRLAVYHLSASDPLPCIINPIDAKARFPALSKLSPGRRTLMYGDIVIKHDFYSSVDTHCIVIG